MHFDGKVNVTASWFAICMRLTQKIHEFNLSLGWHDEVRGGGKRKMRPGRNATQTNGEEWLWQVADREAREITSIVELSAEVAHRVQHVAYDTRHCCFLSTYQCVFYPYLHVLLLLVLPAVIVVYLCVAVKFSSTAAKATTTTSSASCTQLAASGICTGSSLCNLWGAASSKNFSCPKVLCARFDKLKIVLPQSHLLCLRTSAVFCYIRIF